MLAQRCTTCAAEWRERSARFCGSCGTPLPGTEPRPRRPVLPAVRRAAAVSVVVVALGTVVPQLHPGTFGPFDDEAPVDVSGEVRVDGPAAATSSRPVPTERERPPRTIGGGLLVVVDGDRIVGSDAVTGSDRFDVSLARLGMAPASRWSPPGSDSADGSAATISLRAHERGVVIAGGGVIVGIDRDGAPQWLHRSRRSHTTVVVADGDRTVLSGPLAPGDRLLLEVVDTPDGTVRFGREIAALVGVEEQTAIVVGAADDSGVTAVSLHDGSVRWHLARGGAGDVDDR